jgi:two-component system sensor histidine kinase BaeS
MIESLEKVFQEQQARRFLVIAAGMLAAVVLNAALIAHWVARRLDPLRKGANRLAEGDYGTRIAVAGHDEFSQLATDFNNLASALENARHSRQRWIADIAHELRTPLTTLRAEIEAFQDGIRPLTATGINSLAQETGRLTRLVEDLHLLSLSDLGALHYDFSSLDLGHQVQTCLAANETNNRRASTGCFTRTRSDSTDSWRRNPPGPSSRQPPAEHAALYRSPAPPARRIVPT